MRISYGSRTLFAALCVTLAGGCQAPEDDSAFAPRSDTLGPYTTGDDPDTSAGDPCAPKTRCGRECVDLDLDPDHCGMCGFACERGEVCVDGSCVAVCPMGQIECAGVCTHPALVAGPVTQDPGGSEETFLYTGEPQLFIVPSCVARVNVELWGAQGGPSECGKEEEFDLPDTQNDGGFGGRVEAALSVIPGTKLHVFVGGMGGIEGVPGWNGGGAGGQWAGGGGGASDVRIGGHSLADRVLVSGGGGGGQCGFPDHGAGGAGGGLAGEPGLAGQIDWEPGGGGTQAAGGAAGSLPGEPGAPGKGGGSGQYHVAGGGGGYRGGGSAYGAGGGGGSSYLGGVPGASSLGGVRAGNGMIRISW